MRTTIVFSTRTRQAGDDSSYCYYDYDMLSETRELRSASAWHFARREPKSRATERLFESGEGRGSNRYIIECKASYDVIKYGVMYNNI